MARRYAKLDATNMRILSRLQRDAGISNVRLAEAVNLSPSACHERVRSLERDGIVRRRIADLDLSRLCSAVTLFVEVILKEHREQDFRRFTAAMNSRQEVVQCFKIGGRIDFLMQVVCRDIDHYNEFSDALSDVGLGVEKCHGHVVLATSKPFSGYPIEVLAALED